MLKKTEIELSFVVIAYNEERRIATTLQSLLSQSTNSIFEILVVSDGSTDKTSLVAEEKLRHFQNNQVISLQQNRGRGFARLTGLGAAKGKLIAFVDSDVELPFNWVERCMEVLKSENCDAVSGVAIPDGDCVVISRISNLDPKIRKGSAALTGNNLLIKRSVIDVVPFPDMPYGDDIRLAWELERAGYRIKSVPDLVIKHSETKSVYKTVRWQFQQGNDATLLLFQYHKFRLPDLAWIFSILILVIPGVFTPLAIRVLVFSEMIFIIITSLLFLVSRFRLKFLSPQTYMAIAINSLFMFSYLIGRYSGCLIPSNLILRRKS